MEIRPGQVAVVTGAAHGIGNAVATRLVAERVKVALIDIDADALAKTAVQLESAGGEVLPIETDVTDLGAVEQAARLVSAHFGEIDLLVSNAGVIAKGRRPIWEIHSGEWRHVLDVNLDGPFHVLRTFLPGLVARGTGHVVTIASWAGLNAAPHAADYVTSKHGMVGLAESLRLELAIYAPEVRLTLVCPGPVRTRLIEGIPALEGLGIQPRELAELIIAGIRADETRVLTSFELAPPSGE